MKIEFGDKRAILMYLCYSAAEDETSRTWSVVFLMGCLIKFQIDN